MDGNQWLVFGQCRNAAFQSLADNNALSLVYKSAHCCQLKSSRDERDEERGRKRERESVEMVKKGAAGPGEAMRKGGERRLGSRLRLGGENLLKISGVESTVGKVEEERASGRGERWKRGTKSGNVGV